MSSSFQIIEHTADVGIEARSDTLTGLFTACAEGLLDITGASTEAPTQQDPVVLDARDLGGLLVDWLNEILYLQETQDRLIGALLVEEVATDATEARLRAAVPMRPRDREIEGTAVKAATFHGLVVERQGTEWLARVYVDV